ncbi:Ppx/GppA phosphatase [Candidatus Vecturithrix granuli]|uniref:Ppx/GppA phosphatase n=1 Tax=Vecturithrix granuli TaxID=1499967 RepID=A0A081BVZ4_VECG1|nr:Ppx/GppA phosphatase [Candidatus Vecturithrix granuli]
MAKYAVIDIGTNSIKFHIAAKDAAGQWSVVLDEANISRLGEGLQATGNISPEAMERNVQVVAEMAARAREQGAVEIVAVGTMCLRTAHNAQEFVKRVKDACDVTVEILPGEEEARLAYLAIKSGIGLDKGKLVIFDTGGGSTEFIFGQDERIEKRFSLNVGAVRYTEQILKSNPVTPAELQQAMTAIEQDLAADLHIEGAVDALVGMGGTATNLSAVKHQLAKYDPDVIQGSTLELAEIERQIALYQSKTIEERKKIIGLQPKRADVILAGALIVKIIMQLTGASAFTVSDRGLRHGLIVDRFA